MNKDGSEPKTGPDAPYTVRDVNKKLDALVDEANAVCYLSSYDANAEVSPVALKEALENSESDVKDLDETEGIVSETLKVTGKPIEDVTAISTVIGPHCVDKTTYLTVPVDGESDEKQLAPVSRAGQYNAIIRKN
ncbi:uncharacterized protein [Ptychodera flava]|uniref:uncharacterized protein n=1 Tax=Ptychodera flava TaxID=63121 RepID=UPI00396A9B54